MSEERVLRSRKLAAIRDIEDAEVLLRRAAGKMADLGHPVGGLGHATERVERERERCQRLLGIDPRTGSAR
ncbi:MAG: hypothetical protein JJ863_21480 [Deltaproteobacteria bacterium]|nr:hypothetical protein [Deltaproteobacteria bacterium]